MNNDARIPPQNLEAEQSALGAMLLDREAILVAEGSIRPEDFYRDAHRQVFTGMLDLYRRREPVDLITLGEWLKQRDLLDTIGGMLFLTTIMSQVPSAAGMAHYCKIIQEKAIRRAAIQAADAIMQDAYEGTDALDVFVPASEQRMMALEDMLTIGQRGPRGLGEITAQVSQDYYDALENHQTPGFRTNWCGLNGICSPFRPAQVTMIGGRPGTGKTALLLQMALSFAEQDIPGLMFSLEMDGLQLGLRALLAYMHTSSMDLNDFTYISENKDFINQEMAQAVENVWPFKLAIDDRASITMAEMERTIRRWNQQHQHLEYVMVDYLQLANMEQRRGETTNDALSRIMNGLRKIAKDFKTHVFVLSQLTREVEDQPIKRPSLRNFLGSGSIEANAFRVIGLYRPEFYGDDECQRMGFDASEYPGMMELTMLKQRDGGSAKTPDGRLIRGAWMVFDGDHYRFRDVPYDTHIRFMQQIHAKGNGE